MQTQERVPTRARRAAPSAIEGGRRPWVIAVIAIVVVAAIGIGTWVVVDRTSSTPPDAAEMSAILSRTLTAWNGGDETAIRELYANDAVVEDRTIDVTFDGVDRIAFGAQLFYDVTYAATPASETAVSGPVATVSYVYGPASDPQAGVAFTTIEVNGDGTIQHQVIVPIEGVEAIAPA